MSQVFSPSPSPSDRLASPKARTATLDWSDAALARTWRTAGMVSLGLGIVLHACASWIPGTILLLTGTWAVAKGSPRWHRAA